MRYLTERYTISQRRACRVVQATRALLYYRSRKDPLTALRQRVRELAQTRGRFGYRRLRVLLLREGWEVGQERFYRVYTEEGLALGRKRPWRHASAVHREQRRPAAERNDLMKNIDRWVIGAAMSFCASRKPGALFVRLSQDTLSDAALPGWLAEQLKKIRIEPARIVFQIREEAAAQQIKEAVALHKTLSDLGFRFALEGFGMGRDTEQLLNHLKPDFVKIHGALMQGLSADQDKQARVKTMVELATSFGMETVAEWVGDAATAAIVREAGITYMQGYHYGMPMRPELLPKPIMV